MAKDKNSQTENIDFEISDDGIVKNNDDNKTKRRKRNKKIKNKRSILPVLLFFLFLIGVFLFISTNIFGVRDNYIYPLIRKVPIIRELVPYASDELMTEETKEELVDEIKVLNEDYERLNNMYDDLQKRFNDRGEEIARLTEFEKYQDEFKIQKLEMDGLIANEDTKQFIEYYEKVYPENADKFYKEAIVTVAQNKQIKKLVNTYEEMEEDSAADILEELMTTDINLVVEILKNVDTETSANILAEMTVDNAATITRRLKSNDELTQ